MTPNRSIGRCGAAFGMVMMLAALVSPLALACVDGDADEYSASLGVVAGTSGHLRSIPVGRTP